MEQSTCFGVARCGWVLSRAKRLPAPVLLRTRSSRQNRTGVAHQREKVWEKGTREVTHVWKRKRDLLRQNAKLRFRVAGKIGEHI